MQEIYQCMVSLREFSHGRLMAEGQKLEQYYLLLAFNIMIAFNIKALHSNSINMLHLKSANGQLSISQTCSELNKNHQLPESQLWAGGVFQRNVQVWWMLITWFQIFFSQSAGSCYPSYFINVGNSCQHSEGEALQSMNWQKCNT